MVKRNSLPDNVRQNVITRDGNMCIKCGRQKRLEVHHIIPVVNGGPDSECNLITLCRDCHESAPNEPILFFKYCARHLPPELYRSEHITTVIVLMVLNDLKVFDFGDVGSLAPKTFDEFIKINSTKTKLLEKRMEFVGPRVKQLYDQLWDVFLSNRIEVFSSFLNNLSGSTPLPTDEVSPE